MSVSGRHGINEKWPKSFQKCQWLKRHISGDPGTVYEGCFDHQLPFPKQSWQLQFKIFFFVPIYCPSRLDLMVDVEVIDEWRLLVIPLACCCCCCCLYCSFIMMLVLDVIESLRFLSIGSRRSQAEASIIRKCLWPNGPGGVTTTSSLLVDDLEPGLLT